MSILKLLKFRVPLVNQALQNSGKLVAANVRHQTGACGIEPFRPEPPPPPEMPKEFPKHLLRPPCLPGSEIGQYPPDCFTFKGYYCPTEKIKYKYPPFSENIGFIPTNKVECWWKIPKTCDLEDNEESLPIKI